MDVQIRCLAFVYLKFIREAVALICEFWCVLEMMPILSDNLVRFYDRKPKIISPNDWASDQLSINWNEFDLKIIRKWNFSIDLKKTKWNRRRKQAEAKKIYSKIQSENKILLTMQPTQCIHIYIWFLSAQWYTVEIASLFFCNHSTIVSTIVRDKKKSLNTFWVSESSFVSVSWARLQQQWFYCYHHRSIFYVSTSLLSYYVYVCRFFDHSKFELLNHFYSISFNFQWTTMAMATVFASIVHNQICPSFYSDSGVKWIWFHIFFVLYKLLYSIFLFHNGRMSHSGEFYNRNTESINQRAP